MANKKAIRLTRLEMEIMDALWDLGSSRVDDRQDRLRNPRYDVCASASRWRR